MIQVNNLTKKYTPQVTALDNVSFEINEGEICGYIGTNGAGKTTTVKILIGALEFDNGEVFIEGNNVKEKPVEVKKIIGYVPETANLFNSLTASEYLDFIGTIHDIDKVTLKRRVDYFAELFGFTEHLREAIGILSKGNKQKVLITSALFHDPAVVFFDEPLSGLDANSIFVFQDIVSTLASKNKTIFYCSHLLDTIEKISTKIILLENGKVKFDKKTDELKHSKDFTSLENLFRSMKSDSEIKKFSYEDIFD
jgi:ABC-2 type transport system ATP-binding protein